VATINKDQLDFLAGGDGTMRSGIGSGEAGLGSAGLGWHVFITIVVGFCVTLQLNCTKVVVSVITPRWREGAAFLVKIPIRCCRKRRGTLQYSEVPRERFEKDLSLFSYCEFVSISNLIKMKG
jgi:hypothetical protein